MGSEAERIHDAIRHRVEYPFVYVGRVFQTTLYFLDAIHPDFARTPNGLFEAVHVRLYPSFLGKRDGVATLLALRLGGLFTLIELLNWVYGSEPFNAHFGTYLASF